VDRADSNEPLHDNLELPHQEEEGLREAGLVLVQSRENLRDHFANRARGHERDPSCITACSSRWLAEILEIGSFT
jgi:hypothetical protein